MNNNIRVGIVGGAGYTAGELLRLLLRHPQVQIQTVHSTSQAGKPINTVHTDLIGDTELVFTDTLDQNIDVLFLCVGHGDAIKFLTENPVAPSIKIIDLSQDFRLSHHATIGDRTFVYGLPELNKTAITTANNIANPGCFATAIQLGLLPLAKAGLLNDIYTTGITGSTGAGQGLSASSHFSWRANNIAAYKTLQHQHCHEIHQSLHQLQSCFPLQAHQGDGLFFTPWRGDFTRGIYVSSVISLEGYSLTELQDIYNAYYKDASFTHIAPAMIDLKQVVNTNKCCIYLEKVGNKLVVHSIIDNLLKGASGQAVQNMNLMMGLQETIGLQLKAGYF